MPKTHKDFPEQISIGASTELKLSVVALSYLNGNGGMYAPVVRNLLQEAVTEKITRMDERQRADYEQILQNVKLKDKLRADNKKAPP